MSKVHKVRLRYNPNRGWSYGINRNYFKFWYNAHYMGMMFGEGD